jgi:hypothetical protein
MIDHTETDKAFDEKFYTMAVLYSENTKDYYAVILPKDRVEDDEYGLGDIKSFLHHRIELEVEKAIAKLKKDHFCCKYQTIDPKDFCDYCVSLNK